MIVRLRFGWTTDKLGGGLNCASMVRIIQLNENLVGYLLLCDDGGDIELPRARGFDASYL